MKAKELLPKLLAKALSYVGIHESGGQNCGPVVEMFQRVIGKAEKEPWCVSFVQYCVREMDKLNGSETLLFATESSQILWLKTPHSCRLDKPVPGCIVVWTYYLNGFPRSTGHVGIVKEILDDEYMTTVEGNTTEVPGEPDGVYLKHRHIRMTSGSMRVTGYLKPWK